MTSLPSSSWLSGCFDMGAAIYLGTSVLVACMVAAVVTYVCYHGKDKERTKAAPAAIAPDPAQTGQVVKEVTHQDRCEDTGDTDVTDIQMFLQPQEMCLCLSDCELDSHVMEKLCSALKRNTTFRELNLNGCKLDSRLMEQLCGALKQNTTLHELKLLGCQLDSALMQQLCGALKQNASLQKLDLGENFDVFADKAAGRALGGALATMRDMRELNIHLCFLKDETLGNIVDGLCEGCPHMEGLVCSPEGLTEASEKPLIRLLKHCPEMSLKLRYPQFVPFEPPPPDWMKRLEHWLDDRVYLG